MMQNYDRVVYIGISNMNLDKTLLDDLDEYPKPLLFIGRGIKSLVDRRYFSDIAFEGEAHRPIKATYNGKEFLLKTEHFFQKLSVKNRDGHVLSSLNDGKSSYPYTKTI